MKTITYEGNIKSWIRAREYLEDAKRMVDLAEKRAEEQQPTKPLRQATAKDIFEGNIIWYEENSVSYYWRLVEAVYRPDDQFKAYCGQCGCRYGLHGAYVEEK